MVSLPSTPLDFEIVHTGTILQDNRFMVHFAVLVVVVVAFFILICCLAYINGGYHGKRFVYCPRELVTVPRKPRKVLLNQKQNKTYSSAIKANKSRGVWKDIGNEEKSAQ